MMGYCYNLMMRVLIAVLICVASSKMIVQAPSVAVAMFAAKYPNGEIPYSIANYGTVPYGKTISGQIGTPSVLEDCLFEELPDFSMGAKIILVERNDCTFTQKSINVQKEGGKLAVVIDNTVQDPGQIIMMDDGKGTQVTIPTVLISEEDGLALLEFFKQGGVVLSVTFEVPVRSKSDLQLWLDITDHKNFIFLRKLQPFYQKIRDHVQLSVGYSTRKCFTHCSDSNCFYDGEYCLTPYGSWGVEEGGRQLIREGLRQFFIFQTYGNKWWDYVLSYDDECSDLAVVAECSNKIMKKLGLDSAYINRAVDQSFGTDDNVVLQTLSQAKYNNSINYYPAVVVNSFVYRGNLQPHEIYDLICESLTPQPEGCSGFLDESSSNIATWITISIIAVLCFCLFLVVCYRRMARRQLSTHINKQVNELVNQYISMYENDKFSQGTEMRARNAAAVD